MLDCGFQKATALIWPPGGHDTELNGTELDTACETPPLTFPLLSRSGCSMPQSAELMRWMSVMSDAGNHSLHNGNPFHYTVESATWNGSPEKLSPSLPNELQLPTSSPTTTTTKASNGINNGTTVVEESSQVPSGTNNQLYSSAPAFTRSSMVTGNSMAHTSTSANNSSMGQILSLAQPFKFSNHLPMSNGATRKYQCKMCPQVFHSKADMQMHTQVHMREAKPYKCSQCSKSFANSSYLSQHTRIHLGIKPYRCEICQRKFTQLSHLQQHIRTHTGDKPYKCRYPNCTKAFSQLSNLQSHSRSHQTDKPFKCNSCYKCFTDEAGLLEHIPKHKESKHLKTHICQFCGKSYTQETYLAKHMQKHSDRLEKRASLNRMPVQMPDNYWAKNSVVTCQSSSIECSTNLINAQQQAQQQQQQQQQAPPTDDSDGGHQCLLGSRSVPQVSNGHLSGTGRFDHHSSRLPAMASMNARHSDELIYHGIDSSNKSGNSAFTALPGGGVLSGGANVRMPYFSYEPFNFPNKATSSGMETKKTMDVSPKEGQTPFPNQLIALNQIRNYASMPAPVSITSGEHPISLKEE